VGSAWLAVVRPVELPVSVRAWAVRDHAKPPGNGSYADIGPSQWTLVFDTETTTDPGQGLRVGAYQLRRGSRLAEAGLFYEPAALSRVEIETLRAYAAGHGLNLVTREQFVDHVFLPTALSQAGIHGDFEWRTFCPLERRTSADATTTEVSE
jgi:hypothetical protein